MGLHIDGVSNSFGSRARLNLVIAEGVIAEYALWFAFQASNSQAKYEALLV